MKLGLMGKCQWLKEMDFEEGMKSKFQFENGQIRQRFQIETQTGRSSQKWQDRFCDLPIRSSSGFPLGRRASSQELGDPLSTNCWNIVIA
jgi:hypothetical protein